MLKKENLRKNFLRVKQMADQNLGRAEKSEVLSEDLQSVEKRVELVKTVIQTTSKKIGSSLQSSGSDVEKRLRKLPETSLAHSLIENASLLGKDSVMGNMFHMCGECQSTLAGNALQYEIDVENRVLGPLQEILETDLPGIVKCKKQLSKLTLDMDSARSRWNQAVKQAQMHGTNMASASAKADTIKEEYEETCNRMMQGRDNLATEMYNFISKEADHSQKLLVLMETQAEYHKKALETIEKLMPKMRDALECNPHKPVFGMTLEEHLRVTGRDIALVLEACVLTLLELGMEEEGLFRIAGMASRVKKLKKSFDAGVVDMEEYSLDPHSVAGVLKQYLRELAEPLLTYQLYPEFLQAAQLPQDQRLQALWTSIHNLPDVNYNNFRYLIKFLAKLAEKSDVNKMTSSNIAIVIGPNLLWSEGDDGPNMLTSGTISNLVESIISHANWFFPEAIDFHQTLRGTAPSRDKKESAEVEETAESAEPEQASRSEQVTSGIPYVATGASFSTESDSSAKEGSPEVLTGSSPSFHSVSSIDDLTTQTSQSDTRTTEKGQGEGHRVSSNTGFSKAQESSFSSVNIYTNPPVLRFNPQDAPHHKFPRCSSVPPPISSAKGVHSDVYSTVFALHSLGDGNVTDYLTKVRALWDGHIQQRPLSSSSGVINQNYGGGSRVTDLQRRSLGQEVDFGSYSSFVSQTSGSMLSEEPSSDQDGQSSSGSSLLTSQLSSSVGSPRISVNTPPSPSLSSDRSPTATTNSTTSSGSPSSAPLAESEQTSPRVQRRLTRKPAPPPPPDRPFSIAVTASVAKHIQPQAQTWPRQTPGTASAPESPQEECPPAITEKPKSQRERPAGIPEKPSYRATTLDRHYSHPDRPSMPPPERPKIPPPVVPQHQRSASMGSSLNTGPQKTNTIAPPVAQNGQGRLSNASSQEHLVSQISPGNSSSSLTPSINQPADQLSQSNRLSQQGNARPARPSLPPPPNSKTEDTRL